MKILKRDTHSKVILNYHDRLIIMKTITLATNEEQMEEDHFRRHHDPSRNVVNSSRKYCVLDFLGKDIIR
jgi:hypothetical protein